MKNIAVSVRARLLNLSRETRQSLDSLMEQYAMERFLDRLAKSPYRERFVLKGAQLFRIWGADQHRPTRDLDFLGYGESSELAIRKIFIELIVVAADPPDGLEWGEVKTGTIRDDVTYGGVRATLAANLAGARIAIQIDVGFGDVITPQAMEQQWHSLLGFPSAGLLTYPPETVIAEKLEAAVSLGRDNSRMKDFYDLHWLSQHQSFDGSLLRQSIVATFERRETVLPLIMPDALTEEFASDPKKILQWSTFLRKGHLQAPELQGVIQRLNAFLNPVLTGDSCEQIWHPDTGWTEPSS